MVRRVLLDDDDDDGENDTAAASTAPTGDRADGTASSAALQTAAGVDDNDDDFMVAEPTEVESGGAGEDGEDGEEARRRRAVMAEAKGDDGLPDDEDLAEESGEGSGSDSDGSGSDDDDEEEEDDSGAKIEGSEEGDDGVKGEPAAGKKRRRKAQPLELDEDDLALVEENTGLRVKPKGSGLRRLSKKQARADDVDEDVGGGEAEDEQQLEENLFGGVDEDEGDTAGPSGMEDKDEDIDDEGPDDDVDDFIEYGEGERRPRRGRAQYGGSADMAEARDEAEAIFGSRRGLMELLDMTGGLAEDEGGAGDEERDADIDDDLDDDDEVHRLCPPGMEIARPVHKGHCGRNRGDAR